VSGRLAVFDALPADADHDQVERVLLADGWSRCGVGDWAVVLADPRGDVAARISPFDPVAPYTAELFRLAAGTRQVPSCTRTSSSREELSAPSWSGCTR
jgi:hypothetical protein